MRNSAWRGYVYVVAGWSGCFVMALELLGGRALAPYFGSTVYVWGAVITTFMLALSVGYLGGGYLSRLQPSLAKLCLMLAAGAALAVPCLLGSSVILDGVFGRIEDPRYGALLSSTILFFPATLVSGAISPYAVRLLVLELGTSGKVAGTVFFISTLGSAVGTIVTSFYLVLIFELNELLLGLIVGSLIVSIVGLGIDSSKRTA